MPRLVVVFDSNAYRGVTDDRFAALSIAERGAGVVAVASTFVCAELLCHLADPADAGHQSAWNAVRRLAPHTAYYDGSRRIIRFHVGADLQLCGTLFGRAPEQTPGIDAFGGAIGEIADATTMAALEPHTRRIQAAASFVRQHEDRWANTLSTGMAENFKSLSAEWAPGLSERERRRRTAELLRSPVALGPCARMYVDGVAHLHQIVATEEELQRAATKCEQLFPVPLRLYNAVVAKLVEDPAFNLAKRANLIWDLQLAFTVSPGLTAYNCPIWLITSDRAILEAAREAGAAHFVRALDDYEATIKGGTRALLAALDEKGAAV